MSDIDLRQGQNAIDELEKNSLKLSAAVKKIGSFEVALEGLSEAHKTSSAQLAQYDHNFSNFTSEIQDHHEDALAKTSNELRALISEIDANLRTNAAAVAEYQNALFFRRGKPDLNHQSQAWREFSRIIHTSERSFGRSSKY